MWDLGSLGGSRRGSRGAGCGQQQRWTSDDRAWKQGHLAGETASESGQAGIVYCVSVGRHNAPSVSGQRPRRPWGPNKTAKGVVSPGAVVEMLEGGEGGKRFVRREREKAPEAKIEMRNAKKCRGLAVTELGGAERPTWPLASELCVCVRRGALGLVGWCGQVDRVERVKGLGAVFDGIQETEK